MDSIYQAGPGFLLQRPRGGAPPGRNVGRWRSVGCQDDDRRIITTYDPAGHTNKADRSEAADVEYLYDADGSVIARTRSNEDGNSNTTYFFYFGLTKRLAEETTPQGRTKVRYFVNSTGQTLAQERYQISGFDQIDDADAGTWTWLLRDPEGNVGTYVKSDGTATKQASYDPYGSPDLGGTSGDSNSTLGFQSDHTDDATGNLLLAPESVMGLQRTGSPALEPALGMSGWRDHSRSAS